MPLQESPPLARRLYCGQMMTEEQINHRREYDRLWHRIKLKDAIVREKNRVRCKRYYERHKDGHRDYERNYRKIHRDETWYKEYNRQKSANWRKKNYEKSKEIYKRHNRKVRLEALQMVSGFDSPICTNCGCDDLHILEINHKNGGGSAEYKRILSQGHNIYWLIVKAHRSVDDLEVLCKVCNAKHYVEHKFGSGYKVEFLEDKRELGGC